MARSFGFLTSKPVLSSRYVVLKEMHMSMKKMKSINPFKTVKELELKISGSKAMSSGI